MEILRLVHHQPTAQPGGILHPNSLAHNVFAPQHDAFARSEADDFRDSDEFAPLDNTAKHNGEQNHGHEGEGSSKSRTEIYYCRYCNNSWPARLFRNRQQFGAHCSNCSRKRRVGDPPGVPVDRFDGPDLADFGEPLPKRRRVASSSFSSSSSSSSSSDGSYPSDEDDGGFDVSPTRSAHLFAVHHDQPQRHSFTLPHIPSGNGDDNDDDGLDFPSADCQRSRKRPRKQSHPSPSLVPTPVPALGGNNGSSSSGRRSPPPDKDGGRPKDKRVSVSTSAGAKTKDAVATTTTQTPTLTRSLDHLSRSVSDLFALSVASDSSALLAQQTEHSRRLLGDLEARTTQQLDDCRRTFHQSLQSTKTQLLSALEQEHVELSRTLLMQQHRQHCELSSLAQRLSHCENVLASLTSAPPSAQAVEEARAAVTATRGAFEDAVQSFQSASGPGGALEAAALDARLDQRQRQIAGILSDVADEADASVDRLGTEIASGVLHAQQRLSLPSASAAVVPPLV